MTPEEVFAQLRDIHAPEAAAKASVAYDFRPLIGFAILLALVIGARLLLTSVRARRAISQLDATAAPADQRDALVRLLATSPRRPLRAPPPESVFDPPEAVTEKDVSDLRHWAGRRLR